MTISATRFACYFASKLSKVYNPPKFSYRKFCENSLPFSLKLEHDIEPYGNLKVSLPYSVLIQTVDSEICPTMNKIFVELHGINEIDDVDIQQLCRIEEKHNYIHLTCSKKSFKEHEVSCMINIPLKCNLEVTAKDRSDVNIESIECSDCSVSTQDGSILLTNVKTENLDAKTNGGHILCSKTILGDINFNLKKNGSIQADKLQGNIVKVKSELGTINIGSIYATNTEVVCSNGNVKLANIHGNTVIVMKKGNLDIQGIDGDLNVRALNVDISAHASRFEKISIENYSGTVDIGIPDDTTTKVYLEGNQVSVSDELNFTGETGTLFKQWTGKLGQTEATKKQLFVKSQQGTVFVRVKDWFSSLNLTKTSPKVE